jgi:hypothetical protein
MARKSIGNDWLQDGMHSTDQEMDVFNIHRLHLCVQMVVDEIEFIMVLE